jgi:uncharacterized OsmC-like protein
MNRSRLKRIAAGRGSCRYAHDDTGANVKLILLTEDSIRLEPVPGPMTIEAPTADRSYSPFHMVAGGLAYCTFSVMYAWAENAGLNAEDLTVDVSWKFADDPYRVGQYAIQFAWPSLPAKRLAAAKRVAEMCTLHATLERPPTITIDGTATPSMTESAPPTVAAETAERRKAS